MLEELGIYYPNMPVNPEASGTSQPDCDECDGDCDCIATPQQCHCDCDDCDGS